MTEARYKVAMERLPERATSGARIAHMDSDVRDTAARLRKRLEENAQPMLVTGWSIDEEGWEIGMANRLMTMKMRLTR